MNRSNTMKLAAFFSVVCLLIGFNLFAQSSSESYNLFTDVLDGFGGTAKSDSFCIQVSSGGQPSVVGESDDSNYKLLSGYVYAAFVLHGNANGDGIIDFTDIIYLIDYIFRGGTPPMPMEAGECNCDGLVDFTDIICLIDYIFRGGAPPRCGC